LPTKKHPLRGYLCIASATFLWGISASLGRAVFTGRWKPQGMAIGSIDPLILAQSRTSISLCVLLPILLWQRGAGGLKLPRRDLLHTMLLGVFGVAASNYFYYFAIEKTNVATAIILQYTAPVWVLIYMVGRGLQKPTVQRVSAVGLAAVGSALAIGLVGAGGLRINAAGVTAAVLAAFAFAFYNVRGHDILARYDRWKVLLFTLGSAGAFWMIVNPPWRIAAAHYGREEWAFLLIFAVTSALLPFSLYFAGLQHLDATSAIVASCLEPVFSILIAAVALGEVVRPIQILGILIVLAAIVLVQLPDRSGMQETVVEPME